MFFCVNCSFALLNNFFPMFGFVFLLVLENLYLLMGWLAAGSAEQEGIKANPIELNHFVDYIKRNKLQTESFIIGPNQCKLSCSFTWNA